MLTVLIDDRHTRHKTISMQLQLQETKQQNASADKQRKK